MPDRPGVDDSEALKNLIAVWRDGSADLDARLAIVWERMRTELGRPTININTVQRLEAQYDRLGELQGVAQQITSDLVDDTRRFISEGKFDEIYAAGASRSTPFSFSAPHRAAVNVLAQDMFDDVLVMTQFIDDDAKRFVRDVGRHLTGLKLTSGTPARTQARRLARVLKPGFEQRGMGAVVYRDGSRHGFGEYAEMLIRTKTGVAYNTGTLNQSRLAGIEFYELLDGSLCGLTSHNDPELANGLIVTYETAMAYPLAHPNCRRAVNPRPELNRTNYKGAKSVQSPASRADQAAFEQALRDQAAGRGAGRRQRRPRRQRRARGTGNASRAVATPRAATPATPARAISTAKHTDGIDMSKLSKKSRSQFEEAIAVMDRLHAARPRDSSIPDLRLLAGSTTGRKGGHFSRMSPRIKRNPKRPPKPGVKDYDKKFAKYRENQQIYVDDLKSPAGWTPEILVNKRKGDGEDNWMVTLWHEFAHWQDFEYRGDGRTLVGRQVQSGDFVSTRARIGGLTGTGPEFEASRAFYEAAKNTRAFRRLEESRDSRWVSYARKPEELWARAYSQWVADKSGIPGARDAIESTARTTYGYQWEWDEFETLGPLVEDVLRARGVLE